ncbi:MAG: pentapeptide repeat-containing protein, partial [Planctomycetota bacterium]
MARSTRTREASGASESAGETDARAQRVLQRVTAGESLSGLDLTGLRIVGESFGESPPADFSRCDLRGAHFERVDLARAQFVEANLSGATFRTVNLSRADLRRCAARGSVFSDVNLAYANFAGADLRGSILFEANMADVSFKDASLEGAEVDAIRLSLNGSTHVLGLKEALRALAGETSYPYIAGVSGDCFWLTYYQKTRELNWGGFAKDALRRGLENFGFECELVDEVEEPAAWDALRRAVADGRTVITPLHVSKATILGGGFGGAEWVFVTGIDRGEVLVNCLLGDGLRFGRERFLSGWCMHHPEEEAAGDLPTYYICVWATPSVTDIDGFDIPDADDTFYGIADNQADY